MRFHIGLNITLKLLSMKKSVANKPKVLVYDGQLPQFQINKACFEAESLQADKSDPKLDQLWALIVYSTLCTNLLLHNSHYA